MLDSGYDDAEDLMRLGEGRYASELLLMAKVVVRDFRVLKRALSEAKRTQDFNGVEISRDQLFKSVVILAEWLASHSLEEPDLDETEEE